MRPLFLSEEVAVSGTPRIVGNDHLLIAFKQNGCEKVFDCIGFNMGSYCDIAGKEGQLLDVVYSIDKSVRDGRVFPQFKIKDLKVLENK